MSGAARPATPIRAQGPDEVPPLVFRAGEQALGTGSRVAAKAGECLSRRLDSDKIAFSPRLNSSQMDALRKAQAADAIRLQQLHQSIRNLEASIAAKRKFFELKRSAGFVSRLVGRRTPKIARAAEKLAAAVDRRSLREMRNLLFKIRGQYRTAHKRYAQIYSFHSYANRIAIAHRQQNAL
jgi:hypothetical protein